MHRELVDERKWICENDFLHALNFCNFLPGPEAQQLATWAGWRLKGWRGGFIAGTLFVLPGAIVILTLSILYGLAARLDWFEALFLGIKAAVLAIVLQALLRIAGRALATPLRKVLAVAAFASLFFFDLSFPVVILVTAFLGSIIAAVRPDWLGLASSNKAPSHNPKPWRASLFAVIIWGTVWAVPLVVIAATLGRDHVLWDVATFFSQLAVVTFGGAYAVLAYMAQEAVQGFGWLMPGEMADGLGLAETTPGPLIMVTQFVGYLAAFRAPDPFSPLVAGMLGALVTTWVTFAPCFLWIFSMAPWIDRLSGAQRLTGALTAVTAAVVGIIANLAAWFSLHVLFGEVAQTAFGPFRLYVPEWTQFDWRAAVLALFAALMIFALRWGLFPTLAISGLGGLVLGLA